MKKIKENLQEIGFFIIVMVLLLYVALTPNQDAELRREHLRIEHLRDSLQMEYYKKQLKSQDDDDSEVEDTIKPIL